MKNIVMKSMGNMAKIFFLLSLTMLLNIVEVYADKKVQQPKEGEYFDLVVTPNTDDNGKPILTFKAGNDTCGYMVQSLTETDKRYYIFTTKKWIRVTDAKLGSTTNVKYAKGFDYQVNNGAWKEGGNNVNELNKAYRSEGYILVENIKDDKEYKFSLLNYSGEKEEYKFLVVPRDYLELNDITVNLKNRDRDAEANEALLISKDVKFDKDKSDTIKVSSGDFVKIKVKRTARGVLDCVEFNDEILENSYFLYRQEKEHHDVDDMVQTTASINFDSVAMPIVEKVTHYELTICYSTMEKDKFVNKEKTIIIEVNPLRSSILSGELNITYLIIAIVAALLVIGVIIFVLRRKKNNKVEVQADSKPDTKLHWMGNSEPESKSTEGESKSNTNPDPDSDSDIIKSDSSPAIDINSKSVFKNIQDSEVAEFVLKYLSLTFPVMDSNIDIKDLESYINKLWVRRFCNAWNNKHSENQIPCDSFSVEGIFKTIETGYIGPKSRAKLDENDPGKLRETSGGYISVIQKIFNNGWTSGCSNVREEIKSLLNDLGYEVASVENGAAMEQLKSVIDDSIRKGAETIKELKNSVAELEAKVAANDSTLDNALKEKEESLNSIHQQALDAKQSTIESLNETIEQKNSEIVHLQSVSHDDCNGYIDIVIKQITTISDCMSSLLNGAINASGDDSQYSNVLRNAKESFVRFKELVSNCDNKDKWRDNSYSLYSVRKDLQGFVDEGLRINGWINIISYLNLYAGATAELNETFLNNGVSAAELSRCYSEIQKLLGMFGVTVMVPHLLYEKFDKNYYKHENGDRWITTYSSKLSPKDFDGRIFDMSNVGYQIDDEEYNKPKVFYN